MEKKKNNPYAWNEVIQKMNDKPMSNVFTTSISLDTLDEAPMAYKSIDDIINNIGDTVDVVEIIKPIYNFKASE